MVYATRLSLLWTLILAAPLFAAGGGTPSLRDVPRVNSQRFDVLYELDPGTEPLDRVELWYTADEGRSWRRDGVDEDRVSPASFRATAQGLHGFYVIAASAAGVSGQIPGSSTTPQCWVFVDFTPPVVQLHTVRQNDPPTIPQFVNIRWSAMDNALAARPISLSYREASSGRWQTIAGPMANAGAHDWRVPESVTGDVEIRLTVRDMGGNVAEATSPSFPIKSLFPPAEQHSADLPIAAFAAPTRPERGDKSSETELERALKLYQQGLRHAARGEHRLAESRFRNALELDPDFSEALVGLGGALYAQGDGEKAAEAYEFALLRKPGSRGARQGLAAAYIGQRRFGDAVQQLSRIVQANSKDVEAWLNLGDVSIYQGDEVLAREHYEKAMTLDPTATDTIAKARLRLANLKRLAFDFRQTRLPR